MTAVLTINNLKYRRNQHEILHDVQLDVEAGRIVGLLGENGAGKTTLMRLITGIAKGQGSVQVNGAAGVVDRKAQVSFTDSLKAFSPSTKIAEVVHFYQTVYSDFEYDRYHELAQFLDLDAQAKLSSLSKGTAEKLVIALTLGRKVALYLLDEPFSGIDSMSRKKIINSIIQWLPENATIIISDHYVAEIAPILDEIVVIKDQTVIKHKNTDEIRNDLGTDIEDYYESLYVGGEAHD